MNAAASAGPASVVGDDSRPCRPWCEQLVEWREVTMGWSVAEFREHFTYHAGHLGEYKKDRLVEATDKDVWRWESGATPTVHHHTRRILAHMGAPLPPHRRRRSSSSDLTPKSPVLERAAPSSAEDDEDWQHMPVCAAELVAQVTRKDLSLNRRELGRLFGHVFIGGALLERLERWFATPTPRLTSHGAQLAPIGYHELSEIETAARVFRNWDDQHGGGLRRKAVIGQLNEVSDLLSKSHPTEISRRLHVVMAELSETAALMSWDTGHQAVAQRYYLMALHAARTGNDPAFAANVLAGMARQLIYLGQPADAHELVRLARAESADRATASVQSMLHTREAWALAAMGRVTAFERATGAAEDALTAATPDEPHWIEYYDVAELQGTTGGRLLELSYRDPTRADAAAERIGSAITARRPGRLRSSALDEIGLAEVSLIRGDFEEASRIGHAALDVAEQTSSDRVRIKLSNLHTLTGRYSTPEVADLGDRMTALLSPTPRS